MKTTIASPCSESWDDMAGDDRMRFCNRCRLNVFNLSAMSGEEAEALMNRQGGPPCIRFYRRKDGTVMTRDCPVGWRRKMAIRLTVAATVLFGLVLAAIAFGSEHGGRAEWPDWIQAFLDRLDPQPRGVVMGKPPAPPPPGP